MVFWVNNPFDNLPGEGQRAQRYSLLCRSLVKDGHTVVLWSSDFSHLFKRKRHLDPVYQADEGFEVRLIPTIPYPTNICLARIRSHKRYATTWKEMAMKAIADGTLARPDFVLTSLPPLSTAAVARYFRTQWGCKVIVDIMDAWPETFFRLLPLPKSLKSTIGPIVLWNLCHVAKQAYCQADAVTAVGRTYLDLARSYGAKVPMHLCYHGIARLNNGAFRYSLGGEEPLRLVYIGSMGKSYDLETVIEGVKQLKKSGINLRLDLAGKGPKERSLRTLADDASYINFYGYLSDEDMSQLLGDSDISLVPMFQDSYVAIPYKLADYTAAGLPIINSLSGETKTILDQYQAGTFYTAGDVDSFKQAVLHYTTRLSLIAQESTASARIAKECFMLDLIYPEFVRFLKNL